MKQIFSINQARACDIEMFKVAPSLLLMEQAAVAVANEAFKFLKCGVSQRGKAVILCGRGNNGGDGFAVARILLAHGIDVAVLAAKTDGLPKDAQVNADCLLALGVNILPLEAKTLRGLLNPGDIIVDAIFGTGFRGEITGGIAEVIDTANASKNRIIAVDIPSGLNGDFAEVKIPVIKAAKTVTFMRAKPAHYLYPAAEYCGEIIVAPIGVYHGQGDIFLIDELPPLPRPLNANKGTFGTAGIFAGSENMPGAAILMTKAALAAGAGVVRGFYPKTVCERVCVCAPRAIVTSGNGEHFLDSDISAALEVAKTCTAFGVGPGISKNVSAEFLRELVKLKIPQLLDADALNILTPEDIANSGAVITPHPKEFSRFFNVDLCEVLKNPLENCKKVAKEYGIVCLLKGAASVVCGKSGSFIISKPNPALAQGGSGDILSGIITAYLAQGIAPAEAAYRGAFMLSEIAREVDAEFK